MDQSYIAAGQAVALQQDLTQLAVRFSAPDADTRARALAEAGIPTHTISETISSLGFAPLHLPDGPHSSQHIDTTAATLRQMPGIDHALPVYRYRGRRVVAPSQVAIGLEGANDGTAILAAHDLMLVDRLAGSLRARLPKDADVFQMAAAIRAEPGVRYAEPDLVMLDSGRPQSPPGFVASTVAPANNMALISAPAAWAMIHGNPNVLVAILDEGVDLGHPDIAPAYHGTQFDAVQNGPVQTPLPWNAHGTRCAGLAIAQRSWPGGVAGVATGCSLAAIRVGRCQTPGGNGWDTPIGDAAFGIDWARQNNASVLSLSFSCAPNSQIADAIARALSTGRGGLGCAIVAAAGNDGGPVDFPANMSGVIAVAATNQHDEPKTLTSSDGENWASNAGPEVAIAAPGVANYTTDIVGPGGDPGNYVTNFDGTSSSAPLVAGALGLMLSKNPGLNYVSLGQILVNAADKIGTMPYAGGRNDVLGFGRLNVAAAVAAA